MKASAAAVRAEQNDHPLDLPPAAEMNDVAELPASVGAGRRFARGMGAETGDQLGRVGRRRAVGQVNMIVQGFPQPLVCVTGPQVAGRSFELADGIAQRLVNQSDFALAEPRLHGMRQR